VFTSCIHGSSVFIRINIDIIIKFPTYLHRPEPQDYMHFVIVPSPGRQQQQQHCVLSCPSDTEPQLGFTGVYQVLLVFTGLYWCLPGSTGVYRALLVFTGFYRCLPVPSANGLQTSEGRYVRHSIPPKTSTQS